MARHASSIAARKAWFLGFRDVQSVEDDPQLRIDRRQLNYLALLYRPDGYVVIEIERTRRARRNLRTLEARFGEYEHL